MLNRGIAHLAAGQGSYLPCHAQNREEVAPVWRQIQIENRFTKHRT